MSRSHSRRSIVPAATVLFLLVACLPPVSSVDDYFRQEGVVFRPSDPPFPLVIEARAAVQRLREQGIAPGKRMDPPVFGVLSCSRGPGQCEHLIIPGEDHRTIWVITYPGTPTSSGLGTAYALVDAGSGVGIVFNGPP